MIGVDLSQWNSTSDFKKAKANGLKFVILRAGSGVTYIDSKFESAYRNANAAGVPVGAYWYLYAMNVAQAEKEADLFLARLKGKTFEYPVWLDFEDKTQNILSKTVKTQMALAFMNKVEKAGSGVTYIDSKFESAYRNANAAGVPVGASWYRDWETDRKSTRLNSSHSAKSRMPSSA